MTYLYNIMFVSRNKDNRDIDNFKERKMTFTMNCEDDNINNVRNNIPEKIYKQFEHFVKNGVNGELSRFYISINPASNDKVQKALVHYLIDNELKLSKIDSKVASLAHKAENKVTGLKNRWIFDVDTQNEVLIEDFEIDLKNELSNHGIETFDIKKYNTINGVAIIVGHRFDARKLLYDYDDITTLHKNGDLLVKYSYNV